MLQQDRVNLHADAKATSAQLLDREVSFIRSDMHTIASISTFIGGFLYRQISKGADPSENAFEAASYEILIVAFMLVLCCVVASVLLQVFGPYAALKAKPSELQGVIRKIRVKRRMVLRMWLSGLVCFELSTLALVWARWWHGYAGIATIFMAVADFYMHQIYEGMSTAFDVPSFIPHTLKQCCSNSLGRRQGIQLPDDTPSDVTMFPIDYESLEDKRERAHQDVRCTKCTTQLEDKALFCNVCGDLAPHRCTECHAMLEKNCKFCASCGHKQSEAKTSASSSAGSFFNRSSASQTQSTAQAAPASSPHNTTTGGWLRRQTKFGGQWRNFYFHLEGDLLQKFDRPQGKLLKEYTVPRGDPVLDLPGRTFKLRKIVRGTQIGAQDKPQYLYLQALSDDSKKTWMQALGMFGSDITKSKLVGLEDVEFSDDEDAGDEL